MIYRGQELIIALTSVAAVCSASQRSLASSIIFFWHLFVDLTILSNTPPHQGGFTKLNDHFTLTCDKYCWMFPSLTMFLITLAAALKVLPLSEIKRQGSSLLGQNLLLRLQINVSVDMSGTSYRSMHVHSSYNTMGI